MRSAYGRMASIRVCARRRRADATSSIARVSLRVFVIERTRRLRSWTEATYAASDSLLGWKRPFMRSISALSRSAAASSRSPVSRITL